MAEKGEVSKLGYSGSVTVSRFCDVGLGARDGSNACRSLVAWLALGKLVWKVGKEASAVAIADG